MGSQPDTVFLLLQRSALVDEVKVFDQALTDAQVAELATMLKSGSF